MKIIVVGGGKVGTALCRSLVAENHDVILIEKTNPFLTILPNGLISLEFLGNGANFKILEQADVEDCDIFISMTEYDEVNMVSAVLAKKMGAKETIVRVRNPEYSNSYFKGKKYLGLLPSCQSGIADSSLYCQYHWLPKCPFCGSILPMAELPWWNLKSSQIAISAIWVYPNSGRNTEMSLFVQSERGNELTIPNGDFVLQPQDKIFVTGNRIEVVLFHNNVRPQVIKSMMIIGAGKIAYYLLNILQDVRRKIDLKVLGSIANGRNSLVRNFLISMSSMETELLKTFF